MRMNQDLPHFRRNAFRTHDGDGGRLLLHGSQGIRIDSKAECRRQAGRAQHAELVFGKSLQRIADRPHDARLQVPPSTDVVDQFVRERVVEHPVDGEVAAKRIFPSGAERYGVRSPAIAVRGVTTKRGHFNLPFLSTSQDGDHAKRRADNQRPPLAETAPDLVGRGVGRDVVVVRDEPRELIAHAPSGPQGLKTSVVELLHDPYSETSCAIGSDIVAHGQPLEILARGWGVVRDRLGPRS